MHDIFKKETNNDDRIIKYYKNVISEKFENIMLPSENKRVKRGLVNGFGSIIKFVTGNLDAEDGEKIHKILNHMQGNMHNLQNQLRQQYSISHEIIDNFNVTLNDIQHNEIILKSKIEELSSFIQKRAAYQDIILGKDIINQLLVVYISILNTLQEIENSITFCRLNTLHPSIMNSRELFLEIQKISSHYSHVLPFEVKYKNILEFEAIIRVNCKIDFNKITYFLSLPIYYETDFDLFLMLSIPTKHESEFLTIIPNSKYLLKSKTDNYIKPLSDICTFGNPWHCPNKLLTSNNRISCEEEILLNHSNTACHFTKLEIEDNHMEIIPEINQFLTVFPNPESIEMHCEEHTEGRNLLGIFLIKKGSCKIKFRNQEISFQESSYGKPEVIHLDNFLLREHNVPIMQIKLRQLGLKNISPNTILPITKLSLPLHIPSIWTVFLYTLIIIPIILLWLRTRKKKGQDIQGNEENGNRRPDINLPGGASF